MRVEVWAPRAERVEVAPDPAAGGALEALGTVLGPEPGRAGWHGGEVGWLEPGRDYVLRLDGGPPLPDPRGRWLPHGVDGPSRAWDAGSFAWADAGWRGRRLEDAGLVYELHVGTFTPEGTLDAAAGHLDHLVDLGVSHVELMPLAAFDGVAGWGYDGVALDAVHAPYGGPDALCRFVDLAHRAGLAVLLDVVHNHLGPSGNHWDRFGPFTSDAYTTPWGGAVNLDAPGSDDVRALLVSSAVGWLRDFHLDGIRLDAVHALYDDRAVPYLEELAAAVHALGKELGRPLALVAESDRNDPRIVLSAADGGLGLDAQWDDDVHHGLHWLLTGETQGYYADFGSCGAVAHALERAFLHDGRYSTFRGRIHGREVDWSITDPSRFVVALQTHDQVGNRARGDRLAGLVSPDRLAAGAALLLTLPYTPMLFMGEEWGASTPWQFFSSFPDPSLGAAVTAGRRAEFAQHGWTDGDVPDPQDPATVDRSRLAWAERDEGVHRELLGWYRALVALRAAEPGLGSASAGAAPSAGGLRCSWDEDADGRPLWFAITRGGFATLVNLAAVPCEIGVGAEVAHVLLAWRDGATTGEGGSSVVLAPGSSAVVRLT